MTATDLRPRLSRVAARSPIAVAITSMIGALLFCVVRLVRLGGGTGTFVVAGDLYTDHAQVPGRIPVLLGAGYDGQFMYRLALHPLHLGLAKAYGIRLDQPYRVGRIGYPFVVWLLSFGGRPSLAPTMMVVVNVLAVGVLGYVGARLAVDRGREPAWGLLLAGYWGFGFVLARDLGELVAAAAVFGALACIARSRYLPAALLLAVAVLTREQEVLTVAAISVGVAIPLLRARDVKGALIRLQTLAVPPAVAFLLWQGWGRHVTGKLPVSTSAGSNSTYPFGALPHSVWAWLRTFGHGVDASLSLTCAVLLVVMIGAAVTSPGLRVAWATRPWEVLMGAGALLVFLSSTANVIELPADFRQLSALVGACWLILWCSKGSRAIRIAAFVVPITGIVFAARALVV